MTYNQKLLKPYLQAKYDNHIPFKNSELYLLCGCENANHKAGIRSLKSRYLKEFNLKKYGETNGTLNQKKPNDYTSKGLKEQFHGQQPEKASTSIVDQFHILDLIKKYPELPLFIYSMIFESVKEEYLKDVSKDLNFPFYDVYTEIFDDINKGKYDQEIVEYMKDVIHSFGNTHTLELEQAEFTPEYSEYAYFLEWVLRIISEIVDYFIKSFTLSELRVQILYYLLVKSSGYDTSLVSNIIGSRSKELIRSDILKLYILWKKSIPTDITIYDLYNEFDSRYSDKLDLAESGINYQGQYNDLFYKDKTGELQYKYGLEKSLEKQKNGIELDDWENMLLENKPDNYQLPEVEYDPPIPELESELNRLKGTSETTLNDILEDSETK